MKRLAIIVSAAVLTFLLASCDKASADSTETKYWTQSTYAIRSKMEKLGFDRPLANSIINECKGKAKNPEHCVITASFIATAESGAGNNVTGCNNVFGMTGGCYATRTQAVQEWVAKYDRYWFRRPNPSHFYSDTPKRKPATLYCMSEESSGSEGYCPNGHRLSWKAYTVLTK